VSDSLFGRVIAELEAGMASTRCDDLVKMLESLGFIVRCGGNGKHHVYYNPALSKETDFKTASFDGGHGRNSEVKPAYIRNVLRVLSTYEAEIKALNGE
jgi:hypothetical protein